MHTHTPPQTHITHTHTENEEVGWYREGREGGREGGREREFECRVTWLIPLPS